MLDRGSHSPTVSILSNHAMIHDVRKLQSAVKLLISIGYHHTYHLKFTTAFSKSFVDATDVYDV